MEKGREAILFVDDEESILAALRRLFFDQEGYEIFTASSGQEGLEVLKKHAVAVILSDQKMPAMSGSEFLDRAMGIAPDAVRIILTGYIDVNAAIDAINKGGAYRFITKPWNDDELVAVIRDAAEQYRLRQENRYLTELTQRQNKELERWNSELSLYVQQQTIDLSRQNQELERLNRRMGKHLKSFIISFSNLIEFRDKASSSHSNNVALLSRGIARRTGLSDEETTEVAIAAQLHDIGKIGLPDIMFMKNIDEYTPEEMEEYRKHPIIGQTAFTSIEDLLAPGTFIRHHHESYDGKGFPDGLAGETIPLGSRIIAVSDALDRFVAQHLRQINVMDEALKRIKMGLGTRFDPLLFVHLSEVVRAALPSMIPTAITHETELPLRDLLPGMVVSRDVRSGTGIMIISQGSVIHEGGIRAIKRLYESDPSPRGIYVRLERSRRQA
jgi:response regulator RpfG family c-di-GMP phosphodiesterase